MSLDRNRRALYDVWKEMIKRCHDGRNKSFGRYGAKGIAVCDRWRNSFDDFLVDVAPRPDGHSIDRIDNALGYEPSNVRWATAKTQNRNKPSVPLLTAFGESLPMAEWAERLGRSSALIYTRLQLGWTIEKAVSEPVAFRSPYRRSA